MRKAVFVPASELYDVSSRMPIAHPAYQATDAEVREAVNGGEQRERRENPLVGETLDARVYHVFEGEHPLAMSLCGGWSMGYVGGEPEVDPGSDTYRKGEDCKACSRKAGVLAGDSDE